LTPGQGWVKSQDPDPGSGSKMKNPETIFWVKILKFFDAVPQSGMVKAVKSGSRFWIMRRNSLMSRKFTGTYVMYMILLHEVHA
jgi:hypothetical protein